MRLQLDDNIPAYRDALSEFIRFHRLKIAEGLRIEAAELGKKLIAFTPPRTQSQGKAAVKRDIERSVKPLRVIDFKSRRIKSLIQKRDYEGLGIIFKRLKDGELRNADAVPFSPALHRNAQASRGRVLRFMKKATPDVSDVAQYIKTIQGHVGQGKGGWASFVLEQGKSVPDWIAKHAGSGTFKDNADGVLPYIELTNNSEWSRGGDEDRIVANAIRSRTRNIIDGIAKKQAEALERSKL